MKLSDEEKPTSLNTLEEYRSEGKMKESVKMVCSSFLKAAAAPHSAPHRITQ